MSGTKAKLPLPLLLKTPLTFLVDVVVFIDDDDVVAVVAVKEGALSLLVCEEVIDVVAVAETRVHSNRQTRRITLV